MTAPIPSASQAATPPGPRKTPAKRPSVASLLSTAKVTSSTRELDISFAYDVTPAVLTTLCACMPQLRKLRVCEVGLTEIPRAVGRLTHLRELDVSHNNLTSLPASLGALEELQHLNVSRNQLSALPSSLEGMVNLRLFNANYNALSELPQALGGMVSLRVLRVGANALASLPQALRHLDDLRLVQLAYNHLQEVPQVLWQLPELKVVDLSFNALAHWPDTIVLPGNLSSLNITGNPLVEAPKSLMAAQSHELKIIGLPKPGAKMPQPQAALQEQRLGPDDRLALNATQDLTGILFAGLGDFAMTGEPPTTPEGRANGTDRTDPDRGDPTGRSR